MSKGFSASRKGPEHFGGLSLACKGLSTCVVFSKMDMQQIDCKDGLCFIFSPFICGSFNVVGGEQHLPR